VEVFLNAVSRLFQRSLRPIGATVVALRHPAEVRDFKPANWLLSFKRSADQLRMSLPFQLRYATIDRSLQALAAYAAMVGKRMQNRDEFFLKSCRQVVLGRNGQTVTRVADWRTNDATRRSSEKC